MCIFRAWRLPAASFIGLLALLFMGLPVASPLAQAGTSRFGDAAFTAPVGWRQVEQANALLFISPTSGADGAAVLAILRGQPLTGSFRGWFGAALRASLAAGERIDREEKVTAARAAEGYDVLYTILVVRQPGGGDSYRFFLAAHPGDRVELIVYYASSVAAFEAHTTELDRFIASLHFVQEPGRMANRQPAGTPAPSPSPAPAPIGNGVAGSGGVVIYAGQQTAFTFVPNFGSPGGGNYEYQARNIYYTFLPRHRIYAGLPPADDLAGACATRGGHCGSYSIGNASMQIAWDDGTSLTLAVRDGGAALLRGTLRLSMARPAADGTTLQGAYTFTSYADTWGAGGASSVSGSNSITFAGDGTFSANDFTGFVGSGDDAGGAASSAATVGGRYRVSGYTITFTFASGGNRREVFFLYPGAGDTLIDVGRTLYLRQG